MSVVLLAIIFNHDATSATADALNIRKNATEFIDVPEWQRGISVTPRDSVAAYALRETRGQAITIQVQLATTDLDMPSAEIRAVQPFPVTLPQLLWQELPSIELLGPAAAYYLQQYRAYLQSSWTLLSNVLGEVEPRRVTFGANGETAFETFRLQNVWLWSRGVGVHNVTWRWQFRRGPSDAWIDFGESNHRIYTVLEAPKAPWQQLPYDPDNTDLPWADVMDYACRWAQGASNTDEAATGITIAVNSLGPAILEYDCRGSGGSHYTTPWPLNFFECSRFLERLRGDQGNGRYLNCTDCASIVSTFANILGCDLWQSRMFPDSPAQPFFALNPILAIGFNVWQTACGWPGFAYHEVAWKGDCTENEEVFDSCLHVDGDVNPTVPPHTPLLPTNMRFGQIGEGQYRERLATPIGRFHCQPHPETRLRRRPK